MRIAVFDIETSHLKADIGRILCASVLDVGKDEMVSFRNDKIKKKRNLADDGEIARRLRDHLETFHMTVGWFCLDPSTLILTNDLRWVPAGDLVMGDMIAGFDSSTGPFTRRHWRKNFIEENSLRRVECALVHFKDGPSILASMEHPWLSVRRGKSTRWVRTRSLSTLTNTIPGVSRPKFMGQTWTKDNSYDAGWLAGFLDGEGHLAQADSLQLGLTQREGPELDRAAAILRRMGFDFNRRAYDPDQPHMQSLMLRGGKLAVMELLGRVRPERLIRNLRWEQIGTIQHDRAEQCLEIDAVEPVGLREVAAMATHTSTYVGAGFFHHNSKGFDVPFTSTRLVKAGHRPLRPHLHLDPIWVCKGWRGLNTRAAKMKVMAEFFDLPERKPEVDIDVWIDAALGGDEGAMDALVERCEADVRITWELTQRILDTGLIKSIQSYP